MASRAWKRNISTLQNEQVTIDGQVVITGSFGGVGSGINVNGLTGSVLTQLSGSVPGQFTTALAVTWNQSGSYTINLADVYPRVLSVNLTPGFSQTQVSSGDINWDTSHVILSSSVSTRHSSSLAGATGVDQIGFILLKSGSALADPLPGNAVTVNVNMVFANSQI